MADTYYRKVIRIVAENSPNVRLALAEMQKGLTPSGRTILQGVLSWAEYVKRRRTWDHIRQCIGLDARFYKGAEVLLFPPDWLDRAHRVAGVLKGKARYPVAMGVDPAEGGDKSSWVVIDHWGILRILSLKTPDTSVVPSQTLALMREFNLEPEMVCFDRGGGGQEHVHYLRSRGYNVRAVGFGERPSLEMRHGSHPLKDRREVKEDRYVYLNLRAEMYDSVRHLIDPARTDAKGEPEFFGIPREYENLRLEMSPIPLTYDREGRMYVLPKRKKDSRSQEVSLTDLIGHSPDELDALVLAVHAMTTRAPSQRAGGFL